MRGTEKESSYSCGNCSKQTLHCLCDKCGKLACSHCDFIVADYENLRELCKNCFCKEKLKQITEKTKQIEVLIEEFNRVLVK